MGTVLRCKFAIIFQIEIALQVADRKDEAVLRANPDHLRVKAADAVAGAAVAADLLVDIAHRSRRPRTSGARPPSGSPRVGTPVGVRERWQTHLRDARDVGSAVHEPPQAPSHLLCSGKPLGPGRELAVDHLELHVTGVNARDKITESSLDLGIDARQLLGKRVALGLDLLVGERISSSRN